MLFLKIDNSRYVMLEKAKDLSKLVKKHIVDKNGNVKTVYVKIGDAEKIKQKLNRFRKTMIDEKVEHSLTFDKNGKIVNYKIGNENRIQYTKRELSQIKGALFYTHNHPKGGSFSDSDIIFALKNNIKEIECFGEDKKNKTGKYSFSLKILKQVNDEKQKEIQNDFKQIYQDLMMERYNKVISGEITEKEFSKMFISEVVSRLSKKHKDVLKYEYNKII